MPFPDRISYSSWQAYRNGCHWKWKLDHIDGIRSEAFGVFMDFGKCIHEAIEIHKTRKDPVDVSRAKKHFADKFTKLFNENSQKYREKDRESLVPQFIAAGEKILDHLERCDEIRTAEVVFNEFPLLDKIERTDGLEINFKGFIDMVIKTVDKHKKTILYIIDFKTCSWGWDRDKRQDKDLHYQLFLYKHFFCKRFDVDPKNVRTAFILLKRRPAGNSDAVEFFPISAGPISVQRALDDLNSDLTAMKEKFDTDTFRKNRKFCKNEFGDTCPYFNTANCPGDKDE